MDHARFITHNSECFALPNPVGPKAKVTQLAFAGVATFFFLGKGNGPGFLNTV